MKKSSKGPMDAALEYLSVKARTVREVEEKLDELNYSEYEVYTVVERLKELNYLNDEKYAADFVESRLRTKPVSRRKLKEQLFLHHLPKEAIQNALDAVSDETEQKNAFAVAEKFKAQFLRLEPDEAKRRTASRLAARGFGYDSIKPSLERFFGDAEGVEAAVSEGEAQAYDEA